MAETEEYSEPTIADIWRKLGDIERQIAFRADTQDLQLGDLVSQSRESGGVLSAIRAAVTDQADIDPGPGSAIAILRDIHDTVREAAPLLQSRAAKALRAGGSVADWLRSGRGA